MKNFILETSQRLQTEQPDYFKKTMKFFLWLAGACIAWTGTFYSLPAEQQFEFLAIITDYVSKIGITAGLIGTAMSRLPRNDK